MYKRQLVNGAPAALDTLQELAQALGDDPNFATTITNLIGTKADKTYVDGIITTPLIEVTWQELKDLRDSSALVPGQQYRITDYVTTTTQASTRSAGHQFEDVYKRQIEGDGVFAALLKTYGFKVFSEENFGLTNKYGAEGGI